MLPPLSHPLQARTLLQTLPQTPFLAYPPLAFTHHPSAPPTTILAQTQKSYHDMMVAAMRVLTPAHSMYENAWALAVQSVHAEIWHMHQIFVTEKEADMRKLTSELHRAWYEQSVAATERARLDAELMKIVSGWVKLKTQMPSVMTEALRRGLEELTDGTSGE